VRCPSLPILSPKQIVPLSESVSDTALPWPSSLAPNTPGLVERRRARKSSDESATWPSKPVATCHIPPVLDGTVVGSNGRNVRVSQHSSALRKTTGSRFSCSMSFCPADGAGFFTARFVFPRGFCDNARGKVESHCEKPAGRNGPHSRTVVPRVHFSPASISPSPWEFRCDGLFSSLSPRPFPPTMLPSSPSRLRELQIPSFSVRPTDERIQDFPRTASLPPTPIHRRGGCKQSAAPCVHLAICLDSDSLSPSRESPATVAVRRSAKHICPRTSRVHPGSRFWVFMYSILPWPDTLVSCASFWLLCRVVGLF
jgi:hypothetical protein